MKPWIRNTVGVLCHVPALYMLCFMAFMIFMITHASKETGQGMPLWFAVVFILHLLVMLLIFLLMAFFVIWLLKGSTLSLEAKVIWALGSFMIGPIIWPILYWLYLRHTPDGPYVFGAPLSEAPPRA